MNYNIAIIQEEKIKINYEFFLKYNLNIHIFRSPTLFVKNKDLLSFDLIITDIIMTEMTAIEFLKRIIERNHIYIKIPILFFSELAKDKKIKERLNYILNLFTIDFLNKPVNEKIFIAKVIDIIKNKNRPKYNKVEPLQATKIYIKN